MKIWLNKKKEGNLTKKNVNHWESGPIDSELALNYTPLKENNSNINTLLLKIINLRILV